MKTSRGKHIVALVALGLLISGGVVYAFRKRGRNRKAVAFSAELEKELAPASVGIVKSDAFDINYWKKIATQSIPAIKLKEGAAEDFARRIHTAWGWLNDNEKKIYAVFRALNDHVQVSQVAWWYQQLYGINLIDEIRSRMSRSEVGKIMSIVKSKAAYRTL